MKNRCVFCGRVSDDKKICPQCENEKQGKTLREFFNEEKHIINLLTRDCLSCPLKNTDYCNMVYENAQSEEEERALCFKYVKEWFDKDEKIEG